MAPRSQQDTEGLCITHVHLATEVVSLCRILQAVLLLLYTARARDGHVADRNMYLRTARLGWHPGFTCLCLAGLRSLCKPLQVRLEVAATTHDIVK